MGSSPRSIVMLGVTIFDLVGISATTSSVSDHTSTERITSEYEQNDL